MTQGSVVITPATSHEAAAYGVSGIAVPALKPIPAHKVPTSHAGASVIIHELIEVPNALTDDTRYAPANARLAELLHKEQLNELLVGERDELMTLVEHDRQLGLQQRQTLIDEAINAPVVIEPQPIETAPIPNHTSVGPVGY